MSTFTTIQQGSSGTAVQLWQQFLLQKGYTVVGTADGVFGNNTATATKQFQTASGLPADGVVGNNTYQAAIAAGFAAPSAVTIAPFIGIDVYHGNDTINWNAVKADPQNIHFAFAKATEGAGFKDPQYAANINGAESVGLAAGAYHFFTLDADANTQAQNFISLVGNTYPHVLPPVLDFEQNITPANINAVTASVLQWLTVVANKYGVKPIIYTSQNYCSQLNNPAAFADYTLWVASYTAAHTPTMPASWNNWAIWQYAENGSVQGVTGDVDMNRYNLSSNLLPAG